MKPFRNRKATSEIGALIRSFRINAGYSLDDLAYMTGFTQSLLSSIENGAETGLSHFIEIAKALHVHPKELLNIDIDLKARYPLSPQRQDRNRLTTKITQLIDKTDFFQQPKFVREVIAHLQSELKSKPNSSSVSVTLQRMVELGKLKYKLDGRQKQYYRKKGKSS